MSKKDFPINRARIGSVTGGEHNTNSKVAVETNNFDSDDSKIFGKDLVSGKVLNIDIEQILPNPSQPRLQLDAQKLRDLADSITANGLIQPITVRKNPNGKGYELVAGDYRLNAHKLLGLETIKAIVDSECSDLRLQINSLVENVQRENLTPLEIALGIERIKNEKAKLGESVSYDEIGKMIGKDKAAISKIMSILKLDERVQHIITNGEYRVLNVLTALNKLMPDEQVTALKHIISNKLPREDALEYINNFGVKKNSKSNTAPFSIKRDSSGKNISFACSIDKLDSATKKDVIAELEGILKQLKD